jgi:uncharacterized protein YdeI (BOF family)
LFSKHSGKLQLNYSLAGYPKNSGNKSERIIEMIKKTLTLVVTSSLISAGLLFLGITMLSQFSPARATTLDALVAKSNVPNSTGANTDLANNLSAKELDSEKDLPQSDPAPLTVSSAPVISSQSQESSSSSSSGETPITGTTIAELLKNPAQHDDTVFSITGIATSLNDEKFLLNDGTGQILVEVEDEFSGLPAINGLSVTVTGEFEVSSSSSGPELEACTLSFQGQTFVLGDCVDDDGDDMDDEDDGDDDMDDDDDLDDDDDVDDDGDIDDDGDSSGSSSSNSGSGEGDD